VRAFLLCLVVGASLLILFPEAALGQDSGLPDPQAFARQSLRGYNHMFAAYALAWLLIGGWIISISRRLARVEKALNDG
jgi:CcmD family protein